MRNHQHTENEEYIPPIIEYSIMGIAINNNLLLDKSYLQLEYGTEKLTVKSKGQGIFNCTDDVYSRLNIQQINEVPENLNIYCVKIPYTEFSQDHSPYFSLKTCDDTKEKTGNPPCKSTDEMDLELKDFDTFLFTLVDETDYTPKDVKTQISYYMNKVKSSTMYSKHLNVHLRELTV